MEAPIPEPPVFYSLTITTKKRSRFRGFKIIIRTALASSHTTAKLVGEGVVLILTRKVGETLVIGDEVEVTVLSMKGNQIRLGVKAPKEVAVHREEIAKKLDNSRDNEVSASAS